MGVESTPAKKKVLKKIILVGDSGIGKTSFLNMYINKKFSNQYKATIGADFLTKEVDINGTTATLQIWDTAGRERFQSLGVAFYRGADGAFLLYDITNKRSFESIPQWRDEFKLQSGKDDIPLVLVGLKSDLGAQRAVSTKAAQAVADAWGIPFMEVSSKENINIDESVRKLSDEMMKRKEEKQEEFQVKTIDLSLSAEKSGGFLDW
eukprot:CAMPEP_0168558310 /NCGR_PEP_ID=MMETSP0413-20121227/9903_1 /TAXON_ID=136452 /ORGANISM="Filamoeba nolandi, Strain NC-AS-23-1" /LENGTH=206 /DNA_ID=CAMNT_0008589425 /DNA_START=26 /DNA_END=643 /DNA_ORIENTATION=-